MVWGFNSHMPLVEINLHSNKAGKMKLILVEQLVEQISEHILFVLLSVGT